MRTYYIQLKEKTLKHLEIYKTDITVHDKKNLRGYKKAFLHGLRSTGTDLFLLDAALYKEIKTLEKMEEYFKNDYTFLFRDYNNLFHFGTDGQVMQVSKEKALSIFNTFKNGMISDLKQKISEQQALKAKL